MEDYDLPYDKAFYTDVHVIHSSEMEPLRIGLFIIKVQVTVLLIFWVIQGFLPQ